MSDYRFIVNRQAQSVGSAIVRSAGDLNIVPIKELVIGDGRVTRIEIVSDSQLDPISGDGDYGLLVSIGLRCQFPGGGGYKIADEDPSQTPEIPHNASNAAIIAAWEALETVGEGNVTVVAAVAGQFYEIEFIGALADQPVSGFSVVENQLTPLSSVSIQSTQVGGGGQNERKLIRLKAVPPVMQADWTPSGNGWEGTLNTNTIRGLLALAAAGPEGFTGFLEIRLLRPDGLVETLAQVDDVKILCDVANMGTFVGAVYPELAWANLGNVKLPDALVNLGIPALLD
jgi:hypothetical protein